VAAAERRGLLDRKAALRREIVPTPVRVAMAAMAGSEVRVAHMPSYLIFPLPQGIPYRIPSVRVAARQQLAEIPILMVRHAAEQRRVRSAADQLQRTKALP